MLNAVKALRKLKSELESLAKIPFTDFKVFEKVIQRFA
jgi:hypothetical protein